MLYTSFVHALGSYYGLSITYLFIYFIFSKKKKKKKNKICLSLVLQLASHFYLTQVSDLSCYNNSATESKSMRRYSRSSIEIMDHGASTLTVDPKQIHISRPLPIVFFFT